MVLFSNATKKYYQCSRRPLTSTTSSFIRRRTAARLFTFIATLFIIFSSAKNYQSALSMNQKNRKATFFNQRLKLKRNILLRFPKDLIIFMNIFESVFLCVLIIDKKSTVANGFKHIYSTNAHSTFIVEGNRTRHQKKKRSFSASKFQVCQSILTTKCNLNICAD